MNKALGMIEVRGVTTSMEAMDCMLKAAQVKITAVVTIGAGLVTVFVEGDTGAAQTAVEAGKQAALKLGEVRAACIVSRPHSDLVDILKNTFRETELLLL